MNNYDLKSYKEIYNPDSRIFSCIKISDLNTFPKDFYEDIKKISLYKKVPSDIREVFCMAQNSLVYCYFQYTLSTPAIVMALVALEGALIEKFKIDKSKKTGLQKLLNLALNSKLFDDAIFEGINFVKKSPRDKYEITKRCIKFYPSIRNMLMHGTLLIDTPQNAFRELTIISRMINQIFS